MAGKFACVMYIEAYGFVPFFYASLEGDEFWFGIASLGMFLDYKLVYELSTESFRPKVASDYYFIGLNVLLRFL